MSSLIRLGAVCAVLAFAADQLSKWWILKVVNLDERPPIHVTPFFDLVMAWNEGVSYSLFETYSQWVLILLSLVLCGLIVTWLMKATRPLQAACFGMIIGGALGNALDRVIHGAVADFMRFHFGTWSWYIFNVADIAIVAGVTLLLYDSVKGNSAKPAP